MMPSRWWIPLTGVRPELVKPEHVHAALSRWFDHTKAEHAAPTKPYALCPVGSAEHDGGCGVEVSVLTETARGRLAACGLPGTAVRLGHQHGSVGPVSLLAQDSWESLSRPSGARAWELEFLTPVTFRRGNRSSPLPSAGSALRGLLDSWNACSGSPARELTHAESDGVWVSDLAGASQALTLSGLRISGFVGRVRYRCGDPEVADLVDPLFRLAPYAGVGSARAKGLGVCRLRTGRQAHANRTRSG